MHLTDTSVGFVGSTAIVGNSLPIGTGLALSLQLKGSRQLSAIFLGDGCVEEGAFYESANFAIVRKLPVLFICENNFYSVYSPLSVRQPEGRAIHEMVRGLGMKTSLADGNDVESAHAAAIEGVRHVRSGKGPFFLELTTYRWREHCGPNFDNDIGYRTEQEFQEWHSRDPIAAHERMLLARGYLSQPALEALRAQIDAEVTAAFEFAESSPFPDQAEAFSDEYAVGGVSV